MCCQWADLAAYQTVEATILFEVAHIRATFLMQNVRLQGCWALTGKWPLTSSLCLRTEWVHCAKSEAGVPLCPWTLLWCFSPGPAPYFQPHSRSLEVRDCVIIVSVHLQIQQILTSASTCVILTKVLGIQLLHKLNVVLHIYQMSTWINI